MHRSFPPTPHAQQQLSQEAAARRAAQEQLLNDQLSNQSLETLLRYQEQFHWQKQDLESKIRALLPQGGIGPNGAPTSPNPNDKEIEDALKTLRNDLYRCINMEQTINKHINAKQQRCVVSYIRLCRVNPYSDLGSVKGRCREQDSLRGRRVDLLQLGLRARSKPWVRRRSFRQRFIRSNSNVR